MRHIFTAVLLLWTFAGVAHANPMEELKVSMGAILGMEAEVNRGALAAPGLQAEMATLTRLLEGVELNDNGLAVARYYRGRGAVLANQLRRKNGLPVDRDLAQQALGDFEWVVASDKDVPGAGVLVSNALYGAGTVARNYLDAPPLAYRYWERCAQREHAGCINILASAKTTGAGGIKVDIPGAIELHRKVYDTGTDYSCAGALSALAAGELIYFGGISGVTVSDTDWITRGSLLVEQLATERRMANPCDAPRFSMTEYLVRLSRGEDRRVLLDRALAQAERDEQKAVAGYLLGKVDERAFRAIAAKAGDKDAACTMHYLAYWRAQVRGQPRLAREHHGYMSALGADVCRIELALVGMKFGRSG